MYTLVQIKKLSKHKCKSQELTNWWKHLVRAFPLDISVFQSPVIRIWAVENLSHSISSSLIVSEYSGLAAVTLILSQGIYTLAIISVVPLLGVIFIAQILFLATGICVTLLAILLLYSMALPPWGRPGSIDSLLLLRDKDHACKKDISLIFQT